MRVLLAAYEFLPSPSPQSLRWAYLTRELSALGVDVCVVAPRHPGPAAGLPGCEALRIERTFPGPFMGTLAALRRRRARGPGDGISPPGLGPAGSGPAPTGLNWKGRAAEWLQAGIGALMFPDIRAEWMPWARAAVSREVSTNMPDVIVTSHEPACVLQLGLDARRQGLRWVADLGDPVCAVYTPRRWRSRAIDLERRVCEAADHVTVTTDALKARLVERHGIAPAKVTVVTQGFDAAFAAQRPMARGEGALQLLYTGSLYGFRRPDSLLQAILEQEGVSLSIASRRVGQGLVELAARHPGRIRLLGDLPHREVLRLQRQADVLVDIGNGQDEQVPGKFYEYLGAGRPIVHLGAPGAPAAALLSAEARGWACENETPAIRRLLGELVARHREGRLDAGLDLEPGGVLAYSWQSQAARMKAVFEQVVGPGTAPAGRAPTN